MDKRFTIRLARITWERNDDARQDQFRAVFRIADAFDPGVDHEIGFWMGAALDEAEIVPKAREYLHRFSRDLQEETRAWAAPSAAEN